MQHEGMGLDKGQTPRLSSLSGNQSSEALGQSPSHLRLAIRLPRDEGRAITSQQTFLQSKAPEIL